MLNLLDHILNPLAGAIAQAEAPAEETVQAAQAATELVEESGRPMRDLGGTFWLPDPGSTLAPGMD